MNIVGDKDRPHLSEYSFVNSNPFYTLRVLVSVYYSLNCIADVIASLSAKLGPETFSKSAQTSHFRNVSDKHDDGLANFKSRMDRV